MIRPLVRKPCCAALVIDLYKAFDTVDHSGFKVLSYLNKQHDGLTNMVMIGLSVVQTD